VAQFRILGRVEVQHRGARVDLGRRRERCLLGILLLEAGKAVATERLVDLLWDGAAPESSLSTLRAHVSRLRASLSAADVRLTHGAEGYTAHVDPYAVDAHRFRRLVERARGVEPAVERAALLREALELWRGPLLTDAASERLRDRLAAPWIELRLTAVEEAAEAEVKAGRHREVIGELTALAGEYPYRERFTTLLMLALYRSGRRADALEAFRVLSGRMREDLGLEPGAESADLHQRILTADPALRASAEPSAAAQELPRQAPRQLPADTRAFVGRRTELDRLRRLADQAADEDAGGTVLISAIDGMAGIGKTALALHAAHSLAELFPDGQLFVDLRGHTRNQSPRSPGDALETLLRTLDVPAHRIPADTDERAALYRQHLAGTRTLVVLDNADSQAQINPLIPGTKGCLVIVTSRLRLTSFDDAELLPLDVLSPAEAVGLLRRVVGGARVADDDPLAVEIVELCGRLPIALRVAAALLRARPTWGLGYLAELLRDRGSRVDRLRDAQRDVIDLFDLSSSQLDAAGRRMFALLGLAPGTHIGARAAASLAGVGIDTARCLLDDLLDRSLLSAPVPGRYQFHELLRLYAAGLAERDLAAEERGAAVRRLVDYYVQTSYSADRHVGILREDLSPGAPVPGCLPQTMTGPQEAMAWFAEERESLRPIQHLAAENGLDAAVWHIAWNAHIYHQRQGVARFSVLVWQSALTAAERLGRSDLTIRALRCVGLAHARQGTYAEALAYLERALALAEGVGDIWQQAHAQHALSLLWDAREDAERTVAHAEQALPLFRFVGDEVSEANALSVLAWYRAQAGRYPEAAEFAEAACVLFRRHGHRDGEASAIDTLALVAHRAGHGEQALDLCHRAVELFREIGNPFQEAETVEHLGDIYTSLGRPAEAHRAWQQALALYVSQRSLPSVERLKRRLETAATGCDSVLLEQ
jgi:DNA-binding SARP family transcriptional activator/tetratricopeptide (TPR) repeat protein